MSNSSLRPLHLTTPMAYAFRPTRPLFVCLALLTSLGASAWSQRTQSTDSAPQSSPIDARPNSPADDTAMQASPVSPARASGAWIAPHTAVPVTLGEAIDSGRVKQGQTVKARLAAPVPVHGGPMLPAGTPVELSVIAAVPAGRIMAQGELSLQVLRVGKVSVYTNTLVFDGKPGHQDLPDSAPALGTDAGLASGVQLMFHVQPQPSDNVSPSQQSAGTPGSVNGTAPGGAPPPTQVKSTYGDPNSPAGGQNSTVQQNTVTPANTTTNQGTQRLGQTSPGPNQPRAPAGAAPTTTPRL